MRIKWNEDVSAKTQRAFGLVIGLVVGVLITVAILGSLWKWGVVTGAKWWEVMTAIGTIGAVMVAVFQAIWYAHREDRREREKIQKAHSDDNRLTSIIAASLYPALDHVCNETDLFLSTLGFYTDKFAIEDEFYPVLLKQWERIDYVIEPHVLLQIQSLTENAPMALAQGLSSLASLRKEMKSWQSSFIGDEMSDDQKIKRVRYWWKNGVDSLGLLKLALRVIQNYSVDGGRDEATGGGQKTGVGR